MAGVVRRVRLVAIVTNRSQRQNEQRFAGSCATGGTGLQLTMCQLTTLLSEVKTGDIRSL